MKLTNIVIPDGVTNIAEGAFSDDTSLTGIEIPASVICIGEAAFIDCTSLPIITIPGSVTNIGAGAFEACASLTNATINFGVVAIGEGAFSQCYTLANVTIPGSVTSLGRLAFAWCYDLASVTIGNGMTNMDEAAFENCSTLSRVYFEGNNPNTDDSEFGGEEPAVYYLPGTTGWADFATDTGLPPLVWNPLEQQACQFCRTKQSIWVQIHRPNQSCCRGGSLHGSGQPRLDSAHQHGSPTVHSISANRRGRTARPLLPHYLALSGNLATVSPLGRALGRGAP